ncbi:hypothetical protein BEP19_09935 [Ammoniphilus oxalaticus]|uniref:Uncharacterized protein n=1 Tax=Ammoniphilus oxalaticus TaxID=66863 RepID=A0A419SFK7_9BACL|nr:hypothetical protein BEP19_09935 [Ammoniphilus oxalaticus]
MQRLEKRKIRLQICKLLDQCAGCERVVGKSLTKKTRICQVECAIGIELKRLGCKLLGRPYLQDLTKEKLESLRSQGMTFAAIARKFNISKEKLRNIRQEWAAQAV